MGAYREQLLKETYGKGSAQLYSHPKEMETEPFRALTMFKLKFAISLFLFAGFAWMSMTNSSFAGITAAQIEQAVTSQELSVQLSALLNQAK